MRNIGSAIEMASLEVGDLSHGHASIANFSNAAPRFVGFVSTAPIEMLDLKFG